MRKWMCMAAAAFALAGPAFAQKTDLPDRPAKQTTQFDLTSIKQGNTTLRLNGSCTAEYVVGVNGKAKDIKMDCQHPEMAPFVVQAIETGVWEPEIFEHEFFDSYPKRQIFNYGTGGAGPDPRGETPPALKVDIDAKDIQRAMSQVSQEGKCAVKYTVGADGKPKDIEPNCSPKAYDTKIIDAMKKMVFTPALKGGQPTDWPGLTMPIDLTSPKG